MEKYNSTPSDSLVVASAAAEFAMLLRNSEDKGTSSYEHIIKSIGGIENSEKISELAQLVREAQRLYR